jgi:ABC-type multidrug transport system fused ATPase/permease subunit
MNYLEIWNHISQKKRIYIFLTILCSMFGALLELLSLGSLYPFITLILSPSEFEDNKIFKSIVSYLPWTKKGDLVYKLTTIFVSLIILTNLFRIFILWLNSRVSHSIGADFSSKAYVELLNRDYIFHTTTNSSELTSTLTRKIDLLTNYFILPSLTLFASLTSSFAIIVTLILIDYRVALGSFIIFGLIYFLIGFLSKRKINKIGQSIVFSSDKIFNVIKESFSAIKEIIIYNSQSFFSEPYEKLDKEIKRKQAENIFFMLSPRYVVEGLGIALIAIFSAWLATNFDNAIEFIPILGVLALGAQRLIPQIQNVYTSWANITMSQQGLNDLKKILEKTKNHNVEQNIELKFTREIRVDSLSYSFSSSQPILKDVSMQIKKNTCIGLMGETGSGKTTLINLIMGLLKSDDNKIFIDDIPLKKSLIPNWRNQISFVPQRIFISDSSFIDNIAFGENPEKIDLERIIDCCKKVGLHDFINSLPLNYRTNLGENGDQLSGGQIQRVGLARALYKKSSVMIIDEGTSALDMETEKKIMNSLLSEENMTLILVAHRLDTLKSCDNVFLLGNGKILNKYSKKDFSHFLDNQI